MDTVEKLGAVAIGLCILLLVYIFVLLTVGALR